MKSIKIRNLIAELAIEILKEGIKTKKKPVILKAYEMTEDNEFSWDDLDQNFQRWNRFADKGNDILNDENIK